MYVLVASISHSDCSLTTEDFHRQKLNCEKLENLRKNKMVFTDEDKVLIKIYLLKDMDL